MTELRISQLKDATGFPTATLRYYETIGLLRPARDPNGYRRYDERDVDRLRFVAQAKKLGLQLDQIGDLLELRGYGTCPPVRSKLAMLISDKLVETRCTITELNVFAAELTALANRIAGTDPPLMCGDGCGCPDHSLDLMPSPTISCSLQPQEQVTRVADWQALVAEASRVEETDRGWRLVLPDIPGLVTHAAGLAAAERRCCAFLNFVLTLDHDGLVVEVQVPNEARDLVRDLLGVAQGSASAATVAG